MDLGSINIYLLTLCQFVIERKRASKILDRTWCDGMILHRVSRAEKHVSSTGQMNCPEGNAYDLRKETEVCIQAKRTADQLTRLAEGTTKDIRKRHQTRDNLEGYSIRILRYSFLFLDAAREALQDICLLLSIKLKA